jgi:hypothetical protein
MSAGFPEVKVEQVEATLEDVFIALAGHGVDENPPANAVRGG